MDPFRSVGVTEVVVERYRVEINAVKKDICFLGVPREDPSLVVGGSDVVDEQLHLVLSRSSLASSGNSVTKTLATMSQ